MSAPIAVIGSGHTGQAVIELLPARPAPLVFNRSRPVTVAALRQARLAIIFVPATALEEILPVVLASGIDAVWGTTGADWPADLERQVTAHGARWVMADNFSLGMQLIRRCLQVLGRGVALLDSPRFHIDEVHHSGKQDSPSGTALSWQRWLDQDVSIRAERQGDVKGEHRLQIRALGETIELHHRAHDRQLFARGALWAADYLQDNPGLVPGVHLFNRLLDQQLIPFQPVSDRLVEVTT